MADTFLADRTPPTDVPRHLAIVMDGNGRWAKQRWLPRVAGHKQGVDALRRVVQTCERSGVTALSVFAFSSENWKRPQEEVSGLMDLLVLALSRDLLKLKNSGIRLYFPGERSHLSAKVVQWLETAERDTEQNRRMALNVCFNYGGRWDIVQAADQLVRQGLPVTEENLARHTALAHVGDPDLLIRTGGEHRLSNFLLWQSAYTELYFTDCLWPDFGETELLQAFADYAGRERRFGQTSEQCASPDTSASAPAELPHA